MASGRIRFQIHQFFLLFSAAPHSNTALISACMQNVWRNKIKNKMPHTQRGFGLSTQYFSCIEWIKYSVLSISQWHSHNIYRLLCSASSMSLLPSPSQILISSYVLFIAVKESILTYVLLTCSPVRNGIPDLRTITGRWTTELSTICSASFVGWSLSLKQRVREVSSWDSSRPHLLCH